jgi:hypothetical protein
MAELPSIRAAVRAGVLSARCELHLFARKRDHLPQTRISTYIIHERDSLEKIRGWVNATLKMPRPLALWDALRHLRAPRLGNVTLAHLLVRAWPAPPAYEEKARRPPASIKAFIAWSQRYVDADRGGLFASDPCEGDGFSYQIDHIIPLACGGTSALSNLHAIAPDSHFIKSQGEMAPVKKAARARRAAFAKKARLTRVLRVAREITKRELRERGRVWIRGVAHACTLITPPQSTRVARVVLVNGARIPTSAHIERRVGRAFERVTVA